MTTKAEKLSLLVCAMGVLVCLPGKPAQADITARDIRTQTTTQWDYQPGQGPRHLARDRDFFSPTSNHPDQPIAPPPAVEPGDWRNPPRAEDAVPPRSNEMEETPRSYAEIGLEGSQYHYHEKDFDVKLQGPHGGIDFEAQGALGGQWFLRGTGRAVYGQPHYKGSGEKDDNPDYSGDIRIVGGRDTWFRHFGIAPYTGLGFRAVYNDMRGLTTTGASGYRRFNNLFFVPVGVQPMIHFFGNKQLTMTLEYDQVVWGWQKSMLSDVAAGYPDLLNKQLKGYGLHGSLMYKFSNWSVGPFANYWNIDESKESCAWGINAPIIHYVCGVEPHNHTVEYGMRFHYRFLED